VFTYSDASGVV
jgi:hypothetical protein